MTLGDVEILAKKIIVGILVYLIPVILIFGGLLLTQELFLKKDKSSIAKKEAIHY
jgi:positive regulator of sigma E activity